MKLLIYGDQTTVLWHPLSALEPWIAHLKAGGHQVTVSEDYPQATLEWMQTFDVCINYIDNWEHRGNGRAEQVFCQYVEQGGRMLTLHTGIILPGAEVLLQLHGGAFHHHPEAEDITFCPEESSVEGKEILLDKAVPFTLKEEPYMFSLQTDNKQVYLWYRYRQERYPAGWIKQVGCGTLVYLAPGHDAAVCSHPMIWQLYDNALAFLMQRKQVHKQND